jgi:ferredoxin
MKIRIDEEKCTGHGRCYALAPELFEPDDYGHGVVIDRQDVDGKDSERVLRQAKLAESNCPERAITVEP